MSRPGEEDRFGVPETAFEAARESHGNSPFVRMGMYVPTRREVRTLPPHDVYVILDLWFFEGPAELIPHDEQVAEVKAVLLQRMDADTLDVLKIIEMCDDYMRPREAPGE